MEITWHGKGSFTLKIDGKTFVCNPYKGTKIAKGDVTLLSKDNKDLFDDAHINNEDTFIVDWPGEYELFDIFVRGVEIEQGKENEVHTMYTINSIEGITICHLGDLSKKLPTSQISKLGSVNVLIIPIGNTDVLDPKQALEVIEEIEPNIVIPAYYDSDEQLATFSKVTSMKAPEAVDNLKLTKNDFQLEGTTLRVLNQK